MVSERSGAIPVAAMVENIVGCKWSLRLLGHIVEGTVRPGAMQRACPGLSAKVLNERLRKLLRFGILERRVRGDKPPVEVAYPLTPFGRRFVKILLEVRRLQEELDRGAASMSDSGARSRRGRGILPS